MADSSYSNFVGQQGETGATGPQGPAGPAGDLDILTDVTITTTEQWPGPYTVTSGIGAPSAGTGSVGEYYVDNTTPGSADLYGPKASDNTWPLIGTQNSEWLSGSADPVDAAGGAPNDIYYVKFTFTPPSTFTPAAVWGPYTSTGLGNRSYLGYDQTTREWKENRDTFVLSNEGGEHKALTTPSGVSGSYLMDLQVGSYWELKLTGNLNLTNFLGWPTIRGTNTGNRANHIYIAIEQGGSGGYTVTWPANFTWQGGNAPTLATRVGDTDIIHAISFDRGATWLAHQVLSGTGTQRVEKVFTKTADHTITRGDIGNILVLDGAVNKTFTIPANSSVPLPVGSRFTALTASSGHITLAGAAGVTLTGTTTLNTAGEIAHVIKIATDTWVAHK